MREVKNRDLSFGGDVQLRVVGGAAKAKESGAH